MGDKNSYWIKLPYNQLFGSVRFIRAIMRINFSVRLLTRGRNPPFTPFFDHLLEGIFARGLCHLARSLANDNQCNEIVMDSNKISDIFNSLFEYPTISYNLSNESKTVVIEIVDFCRDIITRSSIGYKIVIGRYCSLLNSGGIYHG